MLTPNPPQRQVGRQQAAEGRAGKPAAFLHLSRDALVDQVEELRHAHEDGDVPLGQALEQLGGVERLEVDDAGADGHRQQQVGHLGQRMEQRQDPQHGVPLADVDDGERRLALGSEVAVGQHDSLGVGGGPRGEEDHRGIGRPGRVSGRRTPPGGEQRIDGGQARPGLVHRQYRYRRGRRRLFDDGQQAQPGAEQPRTRCGQDGCHLGRRIVGVERHDHQAGAQHGKVDSAPAGVVVGQDGAAVANGEPLRREPSGDGFGHHLQLAIGDPFEPVLALDLDGDVVWEAADGFGEDVPEVGHAVPIVGQAARLPRRGFTAAMTAKAPRRHATSTRKPASASSDVSWSSVK